MKTSAFPTINFRSKVLKPFWLLSKDDDVSLVDILAHNLLSKDSVADYRMYLDTQFCTVVPFFGSLLVDIEEIFSGISAITVFSREDNDATMQVTFFEQNCQISL